MKRRGPTGKWVSAGLGSRLSTYRIGGVISTPLPIKLLSLESPKGRVRRAGAPDRLGLSYKANKCSDAGTGDLGVLTTTNETSSCFSPLGDAGSTRPGQEDKNIHVYPVISQFSPQNPQMSQTVSPRLSAVWCGVPKIVFPPPHGRRGTCTFMIYIPTPSPSFSACQIVFLLLYVLYVCVCVWILGGITGKMFAPGCYAPTRDRGIM